MPAYYADTFGSFLAVSPLAIEQQLVQAYKADRFKDLFVPQLDAWHQEITCLQEALRDLLLANSDLAHCGIALEFVVPRKMGRIDAVLLLGDAVIALEFKTKNVDSGAADQVEDYCLDLLHFHQPSHQRVIYPIVVGDSSATLPGDRIKTFGDLRPTRFIHGKELGLLLRNVASQHAGNQQISIHDWDKGNYHPVPTIVEAAIGTFAEMEVEDIARADSDPINLSATLDALKKFVHNSKATDSKTICFVTGVPGAGKTLAGLRLVHDSELRTQSGTDSVFLSGNLPLVRVLQFALAKDAAVRRKGKLRESLRDPKTTIDTVLGYKKTHTKNDNPPHEQIVVFDEAQRAWTAEKTAEYLDDDSHDFIGHSEPEIIMSILDRHPWATLIALVGGGQEINRGEAGLAEWGRAISGNFKHWKVAASTKALSGEYGAGARLFTDDVPSEVHFEVEPNLHLDNPTRQFRGKTIARWVEALLRGDTGDCREILKSNPEYPIVLTRDLMTARQWLKDTARGTERYGCIASSEARRLRAEGLELPPARADGVEYWFLAPRGDVRSSFQLEVAANEFQIQGLEIDWASICWGGDFVRTHLGWSLKRFRGTKWQNIGNEEARTYVVNSYRVLLTRARQGMVLFVPRGDDSDITRPSLPFEETAMFLLECGAQVLPDPVA